MQSAPVRISTHALAQKKRPDKPAARPRSSASLPPRQRWARPRNLLMFMRQLQVLISSGTTVTSALASLERQTADPRWKEATAGIRDQVEEGVALSAALARYPELFDRVTCSLVEAGETTGKLPEMLARIVALTQKDLQTRNGVVGALLYPAILFTVVVVVLCVTLTVVVPRFGKLFESLSVPVPPTTQITLAASDLLRSYWWVCLLVLVGTGFSLFAWLKTPSGVRALHTLAIKMPVIGGLTKSFATARIVRLLGTLVQSHLPLLDVLGLVRGACGNLHYAALIDKAEDAVGRGDPVSSAFDDPELIDPSVYEAFRSGEESGRIAPALVTVADFLDDENDVIIRSLTKVLEPLILIVLGAMVGVLAVSMFLPLFDLTAMAGERN